MADRIALRRELLDLIATHKEGFGSGTPESQRIDALIDELLPLSPYADALAHPEVYRGHWTAEYHSIGKLVGGAGAQNQGVGVTASLKVFSMGRMPDIPARFLGNGLEIDPESGAYNFIAHFELGEKRVPAYHFSLASYRRKPEQPRRFFVDFEGFRVVPVDPDMSMEHFAAEVGIDDPAQLSVTLHPTTKLWSDVAYMDDDLRIQLGQLGGHYVMRKTNLPMYSIEYWKDRSIVPPKPALATH
jgi:hypothetical protein